MVLSGILIVVIFGIRTYDSGDENDSGFTYVESTPNTGIDIDSDIATATEVVTEVDSDNLTSEVDEEQPDNVSSTNDETREPAVYCGYTNPENATTISDEAAMSYLALVNNCYRLSSVFTPRDLSAVNVVSMQAHGGTHLLRESAARAAEELFQAAAADGVFLIAISGYRSYDLQTIIHYNAIRDFGIEQARRSSAVPGHSEHQLGLALDLSTHELGGALVQTFGVTSEGMWVSQNAHRFGFIHSYPYGREEDTSIMYEPWHIRYVGVAASTTIFDNNMILEEFLWYESTRENESE